MSGLHTERVEVTVTEARKIAKVLSHVPGHVHVVEGINAAASRIAASTLPGAYHWVSINDNCRIRIGKDQGE